MEAVKLTVTKRDTGKKAAKAIRNSDGIPGVFYKNGEEPVSITSNFLDMRPLIYTDTAKKIDLSIEGQEGVTSCIVKDFQLDPLTDAITHFDLLGLTEGNPITVVVPIKLKGTAVGVKNGGIMSQVIHRIKLTCLPKDLPEFIEVDVSDLAIGQSIQLDSLKKEEFSFRIKNNALVTHVIPPRVKKAK
jgi:large subunit ribosomal protein L25